MRGVVERSFPPYKKVGVGRRFRDNVKFLGGILSVVWNPMDLRQGCVHDIADVTLTTVRCSSKYFQSSYIQNFQCTFENLSVSVAGSYHSNFTYEFAWRKQVKGIPW